MTAHSETNGRMKFSWQQFTWTLVIVFTMGGFYWKVNDMALRVTTLTQEVSALKEAQIKTGLQIRATQFSPDDADQLRTDIMSDVKAQLHRHDTALLERMDAGDRRTIEELHHLESRLPRTKAGQR